MEGGRRFVLPLALAGILTVVGLFRLGLVDSVAPVIAFAAPLLVCGAAVARALKSGAPRGLPIASLLVCSALAAEIAVNQGVRAELPPTVEVSHAAPARLELAADPPTLDVFVLASVSSNPGARGSAEIELSRAGHAEVLEASFSRAAVTSRSGRRSRVSAGNAHDEERFRVKLPGQGPVSVRLLHVSGSIGTAVRVSAAPVPAALPMVEIALLLAGLGILLSDAFQRDRAGRVAHFSGGAAAFALYLERWFSPNDALSGVLGATIVAVIGAVAIAIATSLLGRALTRERTAVRRPVGGS
jgi:hypothetical protein